MNIALVALRLVGRVIANPIVKSIGSGLIVFTANGQINKFIHSKPETPSPVRHLNHPGFIINGTSLATAALPLRKTDPSEITQIIGEAKKIHQEDDSYSIISDASNTGQGALRFFGKLITRVLMNQKRVTLTEEEKVKEASLTPGLSIKIGKAEETYAGNTTNDRVLSINVSMANVGRFGLVLSWLKWLVLFALALKCVDLLLWVSRKTASLAKQEIIDTTYEDITGSEPANPNDRDFFEARRISTNPANRRRTK